MGSKKRVLSDSEKAEFAANKKRKRDAEKQLSRQWRKINLDRESFSLSRSNASERFPTFTFRFASLLKIFLSFVTHGLVTQIATDLSFNELQYDSGKSFHLSLPCIYKMLAIWIKIYGEQHKSVRVKKGARPLRDQLVQYRWDFVVGFPKLSAPGGTRFMEVFTSHFLFDSRYSKPLSHNFRKILRGIGDIVAGDEKLLHFTGIHVLWLFFKFVMWYCRKKSRCPCRAH